MFKGAIRAWAIFWLGVVAALIVAATSSVKIGLIVFAVALGLTVIQVFIVAQSGVKKVSKFIDEGNPPSPRYNTNSKGGRTVRPQPSSAQRRRPSRDSGDSSFFGGTFSDSGHAGSDFGGDSGSSGGDSGGGGCD